MARAAGCAARSTGLRHRMPRARRRGISSFATTPCARGGSASLAGDRALVRELKRRGSRLLCGMHARSWLPDWRSEVDAIADCGGDLINFVGMQGYTMTRALHPHLTG